MNRQAMKRIEIGQYDFGGTVDVMDPTFPKNVSPALYINSMPIRSGKYTAVVWKQKRKGHDAEGKEAEYRINGVLGIYLNGEIPTQRAMTFYRQIAVDSGMAGFFNREECLNDDEWDELMNLHGSNAAWMLDYGALCESGFGDGTYNVFIHTTGNAGIDAVEIRFID